MYIYKCEVMWEEIEKQSRKKMWEWMGEEMWAKEMQEKVRERKCERKWEQRKCEKMHLAFQGTSCDPDKINRTSQPEMTRSKSKYRLARRCLGVIVLFLRKQPEISIGYFPICIYTFRS